MKKLNELINFDENFNKFDKIADFLMNNCILNIAENRYKIMEIEFYYYDKMHKDTNTHKAEAQKQSNTWYLHQFKESDSFKSGNYKGIDITFGNKESYGGILIRGIKNIKTGDIIAGPSKCVDEIMNKLEISDIKKLAEKIFNKDIVETKVLNICFSETTNSEILFRSSRYGLVKEDEFFSYPYRYVKNDSDYRKDKNFKEKTLTYYYSLVLGIDEKEIKKFSDLKNLDLRKFIESLKNNINNNQSKLNFFEKLVK